MVIDLTHHVHSAIGVRALSCGLLGLCSLNCKAFSYSTTQRLDFTLRLNASSFLLFFSLRFFFDISLNLEPRSIHGIRLSTDHGQNSQANTTLEK